MQNGDNRSIRLSAIALQQPISSRDINEYIDSLRPLPNTASQYDEALLIWNDFNASYLQEVKKAYTVLSAKIKKQANSTNSDLCQVCYQEMTRKRNWCRICGSECCQRCIARFRVLKKQDTPVLFCQKCDNDYIAASALKDEQRKLLLREKSFRTLATQQQQLEKAIKIEREKLEKTGITKNQMLCKLNMITQVTENNNIIKNSIKEVKKMIEFGNGEYEKLKRKLKKLKKEMLDQSNCSSMHDQVEGGATPTVDNTEFPTFENLNQSIINSMLETNPGAEEIQRKKCNCCVM